MTCLRSPLYGDSVRGANLVDSRGRRYRGKRLQQGLYVLYGGGECYGTGRRSWVRKTQLGSEAADQRKMRETRDASAKE